jgi:hypothetical protein
VNGRLLLVMVVVAACSERVDGLQPVGGEQASPIEQERFIRRLHLDLTAAAPSDAALADGLASLAVANTASSRGALADELIAAPEFSQNIVAELENRVFAGELPENRYQLLCAVYRNDDPECQACPAPSTGDLCSECDCTWVATLAAEREALYAADDDLAAGASTADIERQYAMAYVFSFYGGADVISQVLFLTFLGRAAGLDEQRNAEMMIFAAGTGDNMNPNGVLFHRYGKTYADLVDIVFTSEAYRESVVDGVFLRYLGRNATSTELAHFAATLDEDSPDARSVIRAVVSSREYFEQ